MIDPMNPMVLQDRHSLRIWLARGIAVAADLLQLALIPTGSMFGFVDPLDDVLDIIVAVVLTVLLGWHIAFVPSFIVKVIPFADLAPTWTIAVLIATRGGATPRPTLIEPAK